MSGDVEKIGRIEQQVVGLERGYAEVREDVRNIRLDMKSGFENILGKIDTKTTPHWQPISIAVTVMLFIGGIFYSGIKDTSNKHEILIENIRSVMVPRVEHEKMWREQADREHAMVDRFRGLQEQVSKQDRDFAYLQGQLHPLTPAAIK